MVIKLIDIIFVLLINLVTVTFTLSIEVLANLIVRLLLKSFMQVVKLINVTIILLIELMIDIILTQILKVINRKNSLTRFV